MVILMMEIEVHTKLVCGEVGGDISRRDEVSERDWGGGNWFNLVVQLESF